MTHADVTNRKQNAQHASVHLVLANSATNVLAHLADASATNNPHSPTKKSPIKGDFILQGHVLPYSTDDSVTLSPRLNNFL